MDNKDCESGSCSLTQAQMDFVNSNKSSKTTKQTENGIKIKIFGKKDCSNCKAATEKINVYLVNVANKPAVIYYDMDTLEGLSEAAAYSAFDVPTIIAENNGAEIKRWSTAPAEEEFKNVCS